MQTYGGMWSRMELTEDFDEFPWQQYVTVSMILILY